MPIVLPNQGLPDWLNWMIRSTGGDPPDLVMATWVNNLVPTQTTAFNDIVRSSWLGSSEWLITRTGWTAPAIVSGKAVSTWGVAPVVWTAGVVVPAVYGWLLYNPGPQRLMLIERFDVPRALGIGTPLGILPRLELETEPP